MAMNRDHAFKRVLGFALGLLAFCGCCSLAAASPAEPGNALARPPLEIHQGRYFLKNPISISILEGKSKPGEMSEG
jgi:hypothetical protein